MIERVTDFNSLSGVSSPLLPLLYADFKFTVNGNDGAYLQTVSGENTVALSVKNGCANLIVLSDGYDCDELKSFLSFSYITNIVSDFLFDADLKPCSLMQKTTEKAETAEACVVSSTSDIKAYYTVFSLLNDGKHAFDDWFPAFSKKINNGNAAAVYITENGIPVSCAVSPAIFENTAVIGGVFTDKSFRQMGFGSRSVNALSCKLNAMGVEKAYLWCEEHNVGFYKKLGFTENGCVYIREDF